MFYVGKGKNNRYKDKTNRNKFFKDMLNTHNCDVRIIEKNLTEKEAFQKEIELIKYYRENTNYRLTNVTDGGEGSTGWHPTQEIKNKMSRASKEKWKDENFKNKMLELRQGEDSPYKSQAFRDKISSLVSGENNPNFNHRWSDKQKEHLSNVRKENGLAAGINNPRATKIICMETGEVFDMIKEAQEKYKVHDETSFSIALKDQKRTAGGLHWRFFDESLLDEDTRFKKLLPSLLKKDYYPIVCIETREIFYNRKEFLKNISYGIKRFKKEYNQFGKITVENKTYVYVEDYISRYMK